MTKIGKIGFLVAALCLVIVVAVRFILGDWIPFLYLLLGLAGFSMILSVFTDRKLYVEFLTLRTTKHGMNMGALILIVLSLVFCLNYLAVRHNKTWDVTKEKINSLSDHSVKVLENLSSELEVKVFYKGADALGERQTIRQSLSVYQEKNSKLKVRYIDSYVENILAQEYLAGLSDRDSENSFVFVEYEGRRIRVDSPYGEEQITSALIKATRRGEKKIYFLTGHGERELDSQAQQGLFAFKEELLASSYLTEEISLYEKSEVPADAGLLVIAGPKQPLLDNELAVLKKYLQDGGKVFLAADPGEKHNLSQLMRVVGVDFKNNYVIHLDPLTRQASGTSIGVDFDRGSSITASLVPGKTLTLFDLASELSVDVSKSENIELVPLVLTAPSSFVMTELKNQVAAPREQKPYPIMMSAKGKLEGAESKEFFVIAVGDSDFLTNRLFLVGSNRDLAMNALAALSDQEDLISIRPKQPAGNKLMLTSGGQLGMIVAGISLPVVLLLMSGVFWYRRRGA